MRIGIFSVADAYPNEMARDTKQFYEELLQQASLADQLGFSSFWIAEHHFHQYGVIPRAALWLAAAAQRTERIKLGAAVVVLPFDNPLRTAEDYAMVDILSGGRLSIGVGSGYLQHEFDGFKIAPQEKRDRFNESLEVLEQAWSGKPVSFHGKYHNIDGVAINVLPLQKPMPPIAVAVLNSEAAKFVGASGRDLMMIPYATANTAEDLRQPSQVFHSASKDTVPNGSERLYFALHCLCDETSEEATASVKPYLDQYVKTRLYARQRPFEELFDGELLAVGSASYISRLLKKYAEMGFTDFLALCNFGGMPHEKVCASMKRLATLIPEAAKFNSAQQSASVQH